MKYLIKITLFLCLIVSNCQCPTFIATFVPSHNAQKIATTEGFYKTGSLPNRYHNPGALIFIHQKNAQRGWNNYAVFPNDTIGWNTLEMDLQYKKDHKIPLVRGWKYLK